MKKKESVIKILFNPYSPIITLVVGFLLTLIVTSIDDNSDLPIIVRLLLDNKYIIFILLIVWLISTIIYAKYEQEILEYDNDLKEKDSEILTLQQSIQEKINQLNQSNGIILNKYGEFASFCKLNRFQDTLRGFVDNTIGIECAQIYKYSSKINNDIMKVRVNYESGYAYEDLDINVILQSYFSIDILIYKRVEAIIDLWNKINLQDGFSELEIEVFLKTFWREIQDVLHILLEILRGINNIEDVEDIHFSYYLIVVLLLNLVDLPDEGLDIGNILDREDIENYLIESKRTGILGGILLKDIYAFSHGGSNNKRGRKYISFTIDIYNEHYVVVIVVSPTFLDQVVHWPRLFKELQQDFIKRLNATN